MMQVTCRAVSYDTEMGCRADENERSLACSRAALIRGWTGARDDGTLLNSTDNMGRLPVSYQVSFNSGADLSKI